MKEASYVDSEGRRCAVWLPDGVPESDASLGIHRGPPPLQSLGLPLELEVRLHNELFSRSLFSWDDVKRNRDQLTQALRVILNVSVERLLVLYHEGAMAPQARPKASAKPSLESSAANADNQNRVGRGARKPSAPVVGAERRR